MKIIAISMVLFSFITAHAGGIQDLTIRQKLGQVVQPDVRWISPEQVRDYEIGSVLRGGGTLAKEGEQPTAEINGPLAWARLVQEYKEAAVQSSSKLPLIFAIDAVHGHNNVTGATLFPHNIGLGAANDPSLVERIGEATAREVLATGIDWNFAPTLAVARNERWGRTYESFSENTDLVSQLGVAYLKGLQKEFAPNVQVFGTAKHWIGDGGTTGGVDQGNTELSYEELLEIHLPPYLAMLEAGTKTVMASFNSWNGKKLHEHKFLITNLLKIELGFKGVVVSDWDAVDQIAAPPGLSEDDKYMYQIAKAFDAGVDVFMVPEKWEKFIELGERLVQNHKRGVTPFLDPLRLDNAVMRVLKLKLDMKLTEKPMPMDLYATFHKDFGSMDHRNLARTASLKSAVLLENHLGDLIQYGEKVLVVGEKAKLTGPLAGGWSLEWQGVPGNIPGSESIWDGMQSQSELHSLNLTYSPDLSFKDRPDKIVLVVGENPYAEGQGDRPEVGPRLSAKDEALLLQAVSSGIPVVLILVNGRPLLLPDYADQVSALVSYWLPGTMGSAIAEQLVGDMPFTGTLPFSWPRNEDDLDYDYRNKSINWRYPLGFGVLN